MSPARGARGPQRGTCIPSSRYLRTVLRSSFNQAAMAEIPNPCLCNSKIVITSPSSTTNTPPNQQEWHLKDQEECEDEQDYVECQQRRTAMVGTRPPDQQAAGAGNHCQEGELDGCSPCGEQSVKLASF